MFLMKFYAWTDCFFDNYRKKLSDSYEIVGIYIDKLYN